MKFKQTILPEAQNEFEDAIQWYSQQKKGLGRKFASAVREVLKRLRKMPKVHGFAFKDIRRAVVKGFPYVVLYRVKDQEVVVISIFHCSQDPDKWKSRV